MSWVSVENVIGVVVCLRAASMERILQENEALDSIIHRYLDSQSEVTQRTRDLYVVRLLHFLSLSVFCRH